MALNALGLVAAARGDAGPGRRPAPRVARRSPGRSRTRTTSASPTSTSATCSASPAGSTTGWTLCREGIARAEPLRAGPPDRQPAAVQHQRRADQGRPARRGRGADRRRRSAGSRAGSWPRRCCCWRPGSPLRAGRPDRRPGSGASRPGWSSSPRGAPVGWLRDVIETAAEVELWAGRPGRAPTSWSPTAWRRSHGTDEAPFGTRAGRPRASARWRTRRPCTATRSRATPATRRRSCWRRWPHAHERPRAASLPETAALDLLCAAERPGSTGSATPPTPGRLWRRRGGRSDRPAPRGVRPLAGGRGAAGRGVSAPSRSRCCGPCTPPRRRSAPCGWSRSSSRWRGGTASTCWPVPAPRASRDDATEPAGDDDALEAYGLTAREREVLAGAGRRAQQQGDRRRAVHQREDRLGARLQHPAQARRAAAARTPPGSRTGWASAPDATLRRDGAGVRSTRRDLRRAAPCPGPYALPTFVVALLRPSTEEVDHGTLDVPVLAGIVSTLLFVVSYLPMLVKAFRTRDLESYSLRQPVDRQRRQRRALDLRVQPAAGADLVPAHFYVVAAALMLLWHFRYADQADPLPPRPGSPARRGRARQQQPASLPQLQLAVVPVWSVPMYLGGLVGARWASSRAARSTSSSQYKCPYYSQPAQPSSSCRRFALPWRFLGCRRMAAPASRTPQRLTAGLPRYRHSLHRVADHHRDGAHRRRGAGPPRGGSRSRRGFPVRRLLFPSFLGAHPDIRLLSAGAGRTEATIRACPLSQPRRGRPAWTARPQLKIVLARVAANLATAVVVPAALFARPP